VADRWERLEEIFAAALTRTAEERAAYLEQTCAGDDELRQRVEALLRHSDATAGFIVGAIDVTEPTSVGQRFAAERLTVIGPYRLIRELGQGGMGEVWLAEQSEPIRREVALKLIKLGMDSRQVIARFEAERQALAMMDHPATARVFDAGVAPDGRPYFAMEYVRGRSITEHCDRQRLSIDERLRLFVQVCEGVQHAHQKGIIHRDLKPSNVLVAVHEGQAAPKIIDFGVAKSLDQRLTTQTMFTEHGVLVGTPEYMSPEQAEPGGADIDTRSDVYSLGALLYELLVGVRPIDSKELRLRGLDEILRHIREKEPSRPSTRFNTLDGPSTAESAARRRSEPRSVRRKLSGDLDWVTMKALAKERERRYGSASELAADLRRYLAFEPVTAGPPGAGYRARKFVRRHRFGVGVGALVLLFVVVFAVAMGVQTVRVGRERDRADAERRTALAINEFLQETLASANPLEEGGRRDITLIEALDGAAGRIDESFADEPEVRAEVLTTIGNTYRKLSRMEQAEELLLAAIEIRRGLPNGDPEKLALLLNITGSLRVEADDLEGAEALIREALEVRRRAYGADDYRTARSMVQLSKVHRDRGNYDEAESLLRRALEIQRAEFGNEHGDIADTLDLLAGLADRRGDFAAAAELHRENLALRRKLYGDKHPDVTDSLHNLAFELRALGQLEEAGALYREVLELDRELLGEEHKYTAGSMTMLATVLLDQGRIDEAEELFLRALEIRRAVLRPDHHDIAASLAYLGDIAVARQQYDTAESFYREGLELLRSRFDETNPRICRAQSDVATALHRRGDLEEGGEMFRGALKNCLATLEDDNPRVAAIRTSYGALLVDAGKFDEAQTQLDSAIATLESRLGAEHAQTVKARNALDALTRARQAATEPADPGR
jgi:non-specific serine/threonine protein kinase/serine/threonine-protein kinase